MAYTCSLYVVLNDGQVRAVDLVSLELSSSSLFRASCGVEPCESMSIEASAARHACQMHPLFTILPQSSPRALSELSVRCDSNWKLVLHFLECSQCSPAWSTGGENGNKVRATVVEQILCPSISMCSFANFSDGFLNP